MDIYVWISIWLLEVTWLKSAVFCTKDSERQSSDVDIGIYMVTVEEWTSSGVKRSFEGTVVSEANTLCEARPATCGLTDWNTSSLFQSSHVDYTNSPAYSKPTLNLKYALLLPGGASKDPSRNQYYLRKAALEAVSVKSRGTLKSIAVIGDTKYGPVPDVTINTAVAVSVFLLTLILLIVLLVLRAKCDDSPEKEAQHQKEAGVLLQMTPKSGSPIPEPVTTKPVTPVEEVRKGDDDQNGRVEAPPDTMVVSETNLDVMENVEKF